MAMSSTTAGTYPESVSSCHPPTPPPSPPPRTAPASAIHGAPLRRRFDFADASSGGRLDDDHDDDNDDFIRAVECIEQGYGEAKRRAPPCVCGRGDCAVVRDEQSGRWMYVCPSQPKCNHVSVCEEVGLELEFQPAVWSHPKPRNNCVINIPSNQVAEPSTSINNVNLHDDDAKAPDIASPQATIPKTALNSTFQSARTITSLHVSPDGQGATEAVKISPQGARSNDKWPICKCTAGKCKILRLGSEEYYVCRIPKGQGACSHMVRVVAAVNEPTQTGSRGDEHLKDNLFEKEAHVNNLSEGEGINANGSVNPLQPVEKEVHVQLEDNNANASVNPQSDDEWPFEVINNEIVLTAQRMPSAEICQASPSMKCQTIDMAKTPTKSPMPPYGTSSLVNPHSETHVPKTRRILETFAELMMSFCSGLCTS